MFLIKSTEIVDFKKIADLLSPSDHLDYLVNGTVPVPGCCRDRLSAADETAARTEPERNAE
jgi:hypothetical protein